MYLKIFINFSNFAVSRPGRYHLNKEITSKIYESPLPFDVVSSTQATFPCMGSTKCIPYPTSPLPWLVWWTHSCLDPFYYLLAFYACPSLYSCLCADESCLFTRNNVNSFSLLHEALHGRYLLSSFLLLCYSYVTSYRITPYGTSHLEITWYIRLLDFMCMCVRVYVRLCVILQHDFKPLPEEINCFLCFCKSFQNLTVYSVNIGWLLLKTNGKHNWSSRFNYFLRH